ncbi:response regulator transcription factor [Tunicatimonas pelagia]|uniref:response regulator transcription factor n=1 Tax=Tunicatimonas pelagia TaxID=931531 RepID=UPI0026664D4F|nr:response regulator transcription factor [Tunicatimonas pelagia]WKN42162.1 response regulator transcription factor [Tunicatimonas pelagia]
MSFKKTKVILVEDHVDTCDHYRRVINRSPTLHVVRTYTHGESALKELDDVRPDVILMDLSLPGISGITCTRLIRQQLPQAVVVIITVHHQPEQVFQALEAGAVGYIVKTTDDQQIIRAISEALQGGAPLSGPIARMIVTSFRKNQDTPLTDREAEVLQKLAEGKTAPRIAEELHIHKETVRTHVRHIYDKLHARSKAEAIQKARHERLL